eukprot:1262055-Rhodomonas_salina.2
MLPRSASMGKQSADAQKQTVWSCPRHSVACECAPPDAMEGSALESLVHSQWKSAEDREAVLTKLKDCGIRSTTVLRKCVQTPVWHSRIPQNCFYRGAPPLINHLINERCDDAKLYGAFLLAMKNRISALGAISPSHCFLFVTSHRLLQAAIPDAGSDSEALQVERRVLKSPKCDPRVEPAQVGGGRAGAAGGVPPLPTHGVRCP